MSDLWIFDFSKILGTFYQLDVEWVSFAVFLFCLIQIFNPVYVTYKISREVAFSR